MSIKSPGVHLRVDSGSLPDVGAELMQDDAASISSSSSSSSSNDFAAHDNERQDEAGLLSPGTSNANLAVPGSVDTSGEGGGGGGGAASLSLSSRSRSRSRTGSSSPRSRTPLPSLRSHSSVPAIRTHSRTQTRSRVSSLGVAVRSQAQAQTLLKCVSSETSLVVPRSRVNEYGEVGGEGCFFSAGGA